MKYLLVIIFGFAHWSAFAQGASEYSKEFSLLDVGRDCAYDLGVNCKESVFQAFLDGATEEEIVGAVVKERRLKNRFEIATKKADAKKADLEATRKSLGAILAKAKEAFHRLGERSSQTEFDAKEYLRCSDGSHNSPLIILSKEANGQRDLRVDHELVARMKCESDQDFVSCKYEKGLFGAQRTVSIDLRTVELVDDLYGKPRNFIVEGHWQKVFGSVSLSCTQAAGI